MMDGNDNYYELFISMAIVSAMLCVVALPIVLIKLVLNLWF